jgi:hypothetical protein
MKRMNAVLLKGHGGFEQLEFRKDVAGRAGAGRLIAL